MNEYCKHTIKKFYDLFISRQFDQDDVVLLFVVARDYFDKGEVFRELGDFIAHPQGKTKGIVSNNIKNKAIFQFDRFLDKYKRGLVDVTGLPIIELLCSDNVLLHQLEKLFRLVDIEPESISCDNNNFREFMFCLIFLLSNYKLMIKDEALEMSVIYSHSLILRVSIKSLKNKPALAQVPVLELNNVWVDCPTTFVFTEHILEHHIARRFDDGNEGFIGAIPFKDDKGQKIYDISSFKRGGYWPLPNRNK